QATDLLCEALEPGAERGPGGPLSFGHALGAGDRGHQARPPAAFHILAQAAGRSSDLVHHGRHGTLTERAGQPPCLLFPPVHRPAEFAFSLFLCHRAHLPARATGDRRRVALRRTGAASGSSASGSSISASGSSGSSTSASGS